MAVRATHTMYCLEVQSIAVALEQADPDRSPTVYTVTKHSASGCVKGLHDYCCVTSATG